MWKANTQAPVLNIGEVKGHLNVNSVVNDYYTNANEAFQGYERGDGKYE